jgi:hypothetical protein
VGQMTLALFFTRYIMHLPTRHCQCQHLLVVVARRINGDVRKWLHELCWDSCLGPPGSFQGFIPPTSTALGAEAGAPQPALATDKGSMVVEAVSAEAASSPQGTSTSAKEDAMRQEISQAGMQEEGTEDGGTRPEGGPLVDTFRMFFPQR